MKKVLLILTILTLLFTAMMSTSSFAVQTPRYSGKEKRFRTFVYKPQEVYRYTGFYLYEAFIEFASGEAIKTISMGDTTAWQIVTLDNKLFLKPIADYPETNMTIITDKRIYHFELDAKQANSSNDENIIYSVRFVYPEETDNNIVQFAISESKLPDMTDLSKYNFNYEFTGSEVIAPIKVFDDGEFTYMEFKDKNAELPAVFVVDSDGYEALINYRMVENYLVIERVAKQLTLRNGGDIVCIYNNENPNARLVK